MYLHWIWCWCFKRYKFWDPTTRIVFYSMNLIFKEVNSSPIVVQLEEDEKKSMVHLPPNIEKYELKNEQAFHDGCDEEEGSKSLKEEENTPPQTLKRPT
jgi:hypothetical protein